MIPCNLQAVVILDIAVQCAYGHDKITPIPLGYNAKLQNNTS